MASTHAFEQNIIALVWDFDKTLITDYMQAPLFRKYQADPALFWKEVDGLDAYYRKQGIHVNRDTIYLNHIITWAQSGPFLGLNNAILQEMGKDLQFYPGLPEFFKTIKESIENNPDYSSFGIKVEHYIVSTGFAATIRGSAVAPFAEPDGIWGAEFIEVPALPGYLSGEQKVGAGVLSQVATALDNTSKTRYLFEVNKGSNKHPEINVNSKMLAEDRRVPFKNMIYIADGPSDVPAFSILNQGGGNTYAIYPRGDRKAMRQVDQLRADGRIQMYGEADYSPGSQTHLWLTEHTQTIADQIVVAKRDLIRRSVSAPPRHLDS
jgi:hypothetical protein